MDSQHAPLWEKICGFEIDLPGAVLPFVRRLARENGWRIDFAHRVLGEYKRFIFLCCIQDQPLTPSDQVDQAWHLHLLYTESYWIDFCRHILGRDIHHGPTRGGQQEQEKYADYYQRTLALYKEVFGEIPPSDIWPSVKVRFSQIRFQRVNLHRYWLIPKRLFT